MKKTQVSTVNMTEGNPYRHILAFALPLFISQLFQQLYNTADSVIVGQFLGTDALAAVAASGNIIFLITSFFEGVAVGAGVLISRDFGRGEMGDVRKDIHNSLALSLIVGVLITLLGVLLTPALLRWINTDADVMPNAVEYFRFYFLGGLAIAMYNICRGIMMALGDSKRPLYYLVFSSCLNIMLDTLFVGVFGFGVWSAAVATVISQFLSVVLCLNYLCSGEGEIKVSFKEIRIDMPTISKILQYGIPSGVQNSVIGFANVIVQSQINVFGKIATATYGSYSKLEGFIFLPISSFNMATTTYVSQNLGAGKYERTKKGARFAILGAVIMAELLGFAFMAFSDQLFALFTDDAGVISLGAVEVGTIAPFYCMLAYSWAIASVCRGAGKAKVPMYIMLGIWCVVRISYILVVTNIFHDIQYIYWAYPLTWSLSSIIYFIYYMKSDWIHGFET